MYYDGLYNENIGKLKIKDNRKLTNKQKRHTQLLYWFLNFRGRYHQSNFCRILPDCETLKI